MTNSVSQFPTEIPTVLRDKKILIVNHSDSLGGAAVVSFRLLQALRQAGLDARMLVYTKTGTDDHVGTMSSRFIRGGAFILERLGILLRNGYNYDNVFKVSTGSFALGISSHPWVKEADIICLNWINQGMMGVNDLLKLHTAGKKIVWTMHDMWTMTGICHHSYECDRFCDSCGMCPFLGSSAAPADISHRCWEKKHAVYPQVPVKFVAVSHWLEKRGRRSSLLRDADLRTIPNAFPIEDFLTSPTHPVPRIDHLLKPNVIVFGAARLDDPIKGVGYAIDALNHIFDTRPDIANNSTVIFFGSMRDPKVFDRLRFNHHNLGRVNDFWILRHLYSSAKVVLSTSLYETLPGTIIEGQASGAIPVTFGHGGQEDIIEHLKNGYIADYLDPRSVADGIIWALSADIPRQELHDNIRRRFATETVVKQYIELFEEFYK